MANPARPVRPTTRPNMPTRYEVVLRDPRGERYLLAYRARKSGRCLRATVRMFGGEVSQQTGAATIEMADRFSARLVPGGWSVYYSGRTEREAIAAGELPPVPWRAP